MPNGVSVDSINGTVITGPLRVLGGRILQDDNGNGQGLPPDAAHAVRKMFFNGSGDRYAEYIRVDNAGAGRLQDAVTGLSIYVADAPGGVFTQAITGATNASPIVLTVPGHPFQSGNRVWVYDVEGNLAARGLWTVTKVDADHVSLNGSTGNGAYTGGGTITNRGCLFALNLQMVPMVPHTGIHGAPGQDYHGDDMAALVTSNGGYGMIGDMFYGARSPMIPGGGPAVLNYYSIEDHVGRAWYFGGTADIAVVDARPATLNNDAPVVAGPNNSNLVASVKTTGETVSGLRLNAQNRWMLGGVDVLGAIDSLTAQVAALQAQIAAIGSACSGGGE